MSTFNRTTINVYKEVNDRVTLSINGRYYTHLHRIYSLAHILKCAAFLKFTCARSDTRVQVAHIIGPRITHCIIINHKDEVWMDGRRYGRLLSAVKCLRPKL